MRVLLSAVLALAYSSAYAEMPIKSLLPYGYGHTIEFSAGPASTINSVRPDMTKGICAGGFDISMRYSYFFGKHFGAYISYNASSFQAGNGKLFSRLDDSFTYRATNGSSGLTESNLGFSFGGVYRYDFGRFSLRPRLGIGYSEYNTSYQEYYKFRPDKNGKEPQHIYVQGGHKNCFLMEASLQLTLSVTRHFFFSLEAGGRAYPQRCSLETTKFETRTQAPSTWKENLLDTNLNRHIDTVLISEEAYKNPIGDALYAKIGLGWNIGFNRNADRRSARK